MDAMTAERRYTIQLLAEPEGGFTVRVPALPEIVTYGIDEEEALQMAEEAIELALDYTSGDKSRASRLLNIGRKTLYRKLEQYENGKAAD